MGLFKSKEERAIEEQMERDEQLEKFNEQIATLKNKREEYAKIAAEAEVNGDNGTYDVAVNALIELNDVISSLMQTKANFDLINLSNSVSASMFTAMNALNRMSNNIVNLPDLHKIQNVQVKLNKYMRSLKINQKAMSSMMKTSNPANKSRSDAEIAAIRPLIDAQRAKMAGKTDVGSSIDIASELDALKNS